MKRKAFDCVEAKRVIQQRILEEFEGLSLEERRRLTDERIGSDPILGPVWRKAPRIAGGGRYIRER